MRRIKTLLACWDEATDAAVTILGSEFELTIVHTLREALVSLSKDEFKDEFHLVVATIRFDESRPLELVPVADQFGVPVALVRFGVSQLAPDLVTAAFMAAQSLGCKVTLDLVARSKVLGSESAIAEFRIALRAAAHHVHPAS